MTAQAFGDDDRSPARAGKRAGGTCCSKQRRRDSSKKARTDTMAAGAGEDALEDLVFSLSSRAEEEEEETDGDDQRMLPLRENGNKDLSARACVMPCAAEELHAMCAAPSPCRPIKPGDPCVYVWDSNEVMCSQTVKECCDSALNCRMPLSLPNLHGAVLHPADVARHVSRRTFGLLQKKLSEGLRLLEGSPSFVWDAKTQSFERRYETFDLGVWNVLVKTEQWDCRFAGCGAPIPGPPAPGSTVLQCRQCRRLICALCGGLCTDDPWGHATLCPAGMGAGNDAVSLVCAKTPEL